MQSDRKTLLQRVSSKFIDGKGTKDQVAGLRTLEARLDAYSAKSKETSHSESEDGARSSEATYMSHEVIIEFIKLSRCRTVSIAVSVQGCVEGVARYVVERVSPLSPHDRSSLSLPPPLPPQVVHARGTEGDGLSSAGRGAVSGSDVAHCMDDFAADGESSKDLTWRINEGLTGLKEHEKAALVENCNEVSHDMQQSLSPLHRIPIDSPPTHSPLTVSLSLTLSLSHSLSHSP